MIQPYIDKLIENLPDTIKNKKTPLKLDLILDGGVFNGSYLIGALYFLKEMEKKGFIKIDRISGCSIGSLCALLYFLGELDMVTDIYSILTKDLRENHHVNKLKEIGVLLNDKIPENICEKIKDKIYISFYNLKTKKKIIKNHFLSKEEVIDVIIRSCFVPFFIDGSLCYKNKYIDGMNPYLFTFKDN
jgi:patatin-like phospholipase domain-containing protein 4